MGVPKFFRYISERYPCLSELAREQSIPDFDNLYLDMNGIIHNCTHPDDSNIHFNMTEEEMFKDIFNYIDKLFFLIKPQKLFFMAVDGVAPRAKMNQQRSRRFRSAKEAEILEQKALGRGEVRQHERFDSNCITPGTEFMVRLQEALRYFVKSKISTDPQWQKCRVILSGHDVPGEGEHKIMDYIRYMKSQSDYDPNTRHCLYGLDADLIILGLCTHELHFVVLREEVKFGKKTKRTAVEETRFFLLHLGLMREYLEMEFDELRQQQKEQFDIAQLIDDWVLMGFLVGNDFIPHLPCLHISNNALPLLYKTYIKVHSSMGGNINEHGKLNLERLEKYFAALSEVEFEIFQENRVDLKYFDAKKSKNGIDEAFDFDISDINNENTDSELAAFIESSRQFMEDDAVDLSDEPQHIADEFENYKKNYYINKLNQNDVNSEMKRDQSIGYITALQWILDYYYCGVQSWDWYYPHHYAPFISDLKNFKDHKIIFNMGRPFLPYEQLLGVLPAASKQLLPEAYRELMTNENSELIHFYPNDFETDLNGKKQEWEAVVLIPFIDEKLLLKAMKTYENNLSSSEVNRNKHGPMNQYDYTTESQGTVPGFYSMKALYKVFCTEKFIWSNEIAISSEKSVCIELPNAARSVFYPGFPTMKHLKYKFELKADRVKVFDNASRNENMILIPEDRPGLNDITTVAEKFLNQIVYIGWPHLIKAKCVAVSSHNQMIDSEGIKDAEERFYKLSKRTAEEHLLTRMGIKIQDFSVLVHCKTHTGTTYSCGSQGKIIANDAWSYAVTAYPAQAVVSEISVHEALKVEHKKVEHLFPVNSKIFFVGNPYFGSEGLVLNPMLVYECGRLKVNITVLPEPDFADAKFTQSQLESDYTNSYQAAAQIGISTKCLSRITGTLFIVLGGRRGNVPENTSKIQIGLQFRFPKQHEERAGFCRRIGNQWFYSSKAISLIQDYYDKFPMVLDYLSKGSEEYCFESDLYPNEVGEGCVAKIVEWLKEQEHIKAEKVTCGSKTVEKEAVEKILDSIEKLKTLPVKTVKLQVKPHLLLKPDISLPEMYKSKRPVRLFDRVVVVKTTYMVPLGYKGTVVGIYPVSDPNPVRLECVKAVDNFFEVLFDKHLPNSNDIYGIADQRVYKVAESATLLIFTNDNRQPDSMQFDSNLLNSNVKNASNNNDFNNHTPAFEPSTSAKANNQQSMLTERQQYDTVVPAAAAIQTNKEDFWMPLKDTKAKTTTSNNINLNQFFSILQKPISNQQDSNIAAATTNSCNNETIALKNLLGMSSDSTQMNNKQQQITQKLPQPPPFWTNSFSKPQNQGASSPQAAGGATLNLKQNLNSPSTNQLSPSVENFFQPCAQINNPKSAFIPLQAMRNAIASTGEQQTAEGTTLIEPQLASLTLNAATPPTMQLQNTVDDVKPVEVRTKKPPRVPKIAAKFDFNH